MQETSISLYYKDARSNKEYHAQLQAKDGGFIVAFQYGPRGGTLTSGVKTAAPVPYEKAKKTYDKLLAEKIGKGYTPGETQSAFVGTSLEERFTGIVPQLLNSITESQAQSLMQDPNWVMQEKYDGHRRLAQKTEQQLLGINRKGLTTRLPQEVAEGLETLGSFAPFIVDGELVGSSYFVFDVLELKGADLRNESVESRLSALEQLREALTAAGVTAVIVTTTARSSDDKRALYERIKTAGREGVVFKQVASTYVAGRPSSGGNQLKLKFTHSASVFVANRNPTKRSVAIELLDGEGKRVNVGNVSIPANYDIPAVGAVVEVEYLYAFEGGSLFQPQYKGVRDDLDPASACVLSQLHYKPAGDSDEDGDAA